MLYAARVGDVDRGDLVGDHHQRTAEFRRAGPLADRDNATGSGDGVDRHRPTTDRAVDGVVGLPAKRFAIEVRCRVERSQRGRIAEHGQHVDDDVRRSRREHTDIGYHPCAPGDLLADQTDRDQRRFRLARAEVDGRDRGNRRTAGEHREVAGRPSVDGNDLELHGGDPDEDVVEQIDPSATRFTGEEGTRPSTDAGAGVDDAARGELAHGAPGGVRGCDGRVVRSEPAGDVDDQIGRPFDEDAQRAARVEADHRRSAAIEAGERIDRRCFGARPTWIRRCERGCRRVRHREIDRHGRRPYGNRSAGRRHRHSYDRSADGSPG